MKITPYMRNDVFCRRHFSKRLKSINNGSELQMIAVFCRKMDETVLKYVL